MNIRPAESQDASAWEQLRQVLWPSDAGEHAEDIARFFAGDRHDPAEALLAFDTAGAAVGFAEVSIRSHADGCDSDRIGYLEGWFVVEESRRRHIGAALVAEAERWARAQGCAEFASDCDITNHVSEIAHNALGFAEVARNICFRKAL